MVAFICLTIDALKRVGLHSLSKAHHGKVVDELGPSSPLCSWHLQLKDLHHHQSHPQTPQIDHHRLQGHLVDSALSFNIDLVV